ncbi:hypothetical protein ABRZ24_11320 [Brenneria populi]|uniref:PIN domain-containing protein n=1 Tax=Brenneria populi TaxID=1505588 RepID=A0ABU6JS09_9GAMM|nr:hypothetical protein [Brenneria populi Li et al. 2015]
MKIYLDHNIIIYLRNGNADELSRKIDDLKSNGNIFLFSPAHLEEIAVSYKRYNVNKKIIDRDISFLTDLCGNNSLRPNTRESVAVGTEYPIECFQRVIRYYDRNDEAEMIDREVIVDANDNPAGSPQEMNNILPEDVLEHAHYKERLLCSLVINKYISQEDSIKYFNSWHFDQSPPKIIRDRFCVLEHSINLIANWLEKLGYYREKETKYRSRLHDVSHIIYGRYSDIFVSNDSKLVKKAQAIYAFLGVETKVMLMQQFLDDPKL